MRSRTNLVVGAILLLVFGKMFYGCARPEWEKRRVKPGMTASQVFTVADGWWMCTGYSQRQAPEAAQHFFLTGDGSRYGMRSSGDDENHPIDSKAKMISVIERKVNDGHPWYVSFSYMAGVPPRLAFGVRFNAEGKVTSVTGTVGAD